MGGDTRSSRHGASILLDIVLDCHLHLAQGGEGGKQGQAVQGPLWPGAQGSASSRQAGDNLGPWMHGRTWNQTPSHL